MPSSLADKIRKHRREKGYSLDKLAKLTNSSKSYLWELENRDTRKPSGEKLTRIAEALSVTTDYLLDKSRPEENRTDDRCLEKKELKLPTTPQGWAIHLSKLVKIFHEAHVRGGAIVGHGAAAFCGCVAE